ncbi:MAG TPA: hypothetical protein VMC81_07590 [Rhodocyclaceae bacterium]|nr:hypothetical protein [Rhodocyclaceae bacterium]
MSTEPDVPENVQTTQEDVPPPPPPAVPPPMDTRRRLRELLAVPERDRTDEQWDEINELEIQLAPGNRVSPGHQPGSSDKPVGTGRQFQQKKHTPKGGGGKRRPRPGNNPNKPQQ